ncbi:hypothetical protein [Catenulispora yoronensis]
MTAILLASGIGVPMLNAPLISILSTHPPAELRAQVMTALVTANLLAGPLAYAVAGPLFTHWGTGRVLAVTAAGMTVCALPLVSLAARSAQSAPQTRSDGEAMSVSVTEA